jgi:arylamine N-acetyltransferase
LDGQVVRLTENHRYIWLEYPDESAVAQHSVNLRHHPTPPSSPPNPDTWIASSGIGAAQYQLAGPLHTDILSTKPRHMDPIVRDWRSTVLTCGTTPHRHPLHQTQTHGSHRQGLAQHSVNLRDHPTPTSSPPNPDTWIASSGTGAAQCQLAAPPHTSILSNELRHMDRIVREATEIELHLNVRNGEDDFCLSESLRSPISALKDRRKPPSHNSTSGFSAGPRRSVQFPYLGTKYAPFGNSPTPQP